MSLVIETFRWCIQNESFQTEVKGSKGAVYGVSFDSRHGWNCTCPAFKFSKSKTCKHIDEAAWIKCDHGWEAAAGSPVDDWVGEECLCPECGGPSTGVRVAL